MEPLISIQLFGHLPSYLPGEILRCDCQIDAVDPEEVQAVETSILWYTEGKGDEDMGVHFFDRQVVADAPGQNLCQLRSFHNQLPLSPLSYAGRIVRICWCVRVRAFLTRGRDTSLDHPFWLGERPQPGTAAT